MYTYQLPTFQFMTVYCTSIIFWSCTSVGVFVCRIAKFESILPSWLKEMFSAHVVIGRKEVGIRVTYESIKCETTKYSPAEGLSSINSECFGGSLRFIGLVNRESPMRTATTKKSEKLSNFLMLHNRQKIVK